MFNFKFWKWIYLESDLYLISTRIFLSNNSVKMSGSFDNSLLFLIKFQNERNQRMSLEAGWRGDDVSRNQSVPIRNCMKLLSSSFKSFNRKVVGDSTRISSSNEFKIVQSMKQKKMDTQNPQINRWHKMKIHTCTMYLCILYR